MDVVKLESLQYELENLYQYKIVLQLHGRKEKDVLMFMKLLILVWNLFRSCQQRE